MPLSSFILLDNKVYLICINKAIVSYGYCLVGLSRRYWDHRMSKSSGYLPEKEVDEGPDFQWLRFVFIQHMDRL